MKRILYAILFVIFCTFTCISQNRTIKELDIEAQLIPIVYYNPTGFTNDILSSFHFNDSKPCYFIKKNSDHTHQLYWYDSLYTNGVPQLKEVKTDLPLSDLQSEILLTGDSVFIFNPLPNSPHLIPQLIEYMGYIKEGHIYFVSKYETFEELSDFLTQEFGSITNFRQRYLSMLNESFYSQWSDLYEFNNDNDAIKFLKDNYKFMAVTGRSIDEILPLYIDLLKAKIRMTKSQESRLSDILRKTYDNNEQYISDFLAGREFEVFDKKYLRSVFSQEESDLLEYAIAENNAKLKAAYDRLSSDNLNIDENGNYTTDCDRLKIIANKARAFD
ncbi:MAG: hypothetical protein K1V86_05870 [Duncaniella sp.]|nr:hypothetical protein EEL51_02485 [Muribaculaceae bacterium Isolate-110 (HZI)]